MIEDTSRCRRHSRLDLLAQGEQRFTEFRVVLLFHHTIRLVNREEGVVHISKLLNVQVDL